MTDAFATLELPQTAALTEEQVRAAYFAKSKVPEATPRSTRPLSCSWRRTNV